MYNKKKKALISIEANSFIYQPSRTGILVAKKKTGLRNFVEHICRNPKDLKSLLIAVIGGNKAVNKKSPTLLWGFTIYKKD
jgi:hypothetical protein